MFLQVEAGRLFAIECWKRLVAASFSMDYTWLYQAHSNSQKDRNKTHHYFGGILLFSCPGACCTYYIRWVPPYPYVYMWIYVFKMYIYNYIYISIKSWHIYIYIHIIVGMEEPSNLGLVVETPAQLCQFPGCWVNISKGKKKWRQKCVISQTSRYDTTYFVGI